MKIKYLILIFLAIISNSAFAKMTWVKADNVNPEQVNSAKIIFNGEINPQQIAELISAIDEINNDYPSSKVIKLYINSFGGSMESAYIASQAVQGSKIPIEAINAAMTASSATLIYCSAKKRYAFQESSFLLHPAASPNTEKKWLRPNDVALIKKDVEDGNKYFKHAYASCTKLTPHDIDEVLFSNDNARYILAKEARKTGLSQGEVLGITPTHVSYYITNEEE